MDHKNHDFCQHNELMWRFSGVIFHQVACRKNCILDSLKGTLRLFRKCLRIVLTTQRPNYVCKLSAILSSLPPIANVLLCGPAEP